MADIPTYAPCDGCSEEKLKNADPAKGGMDWLFSLDKLRVAVFPKSDYEVMHRLCADCYKAWCREAGLPEEDTPHVSCADCGHEIHCTHAVNVHKPHVHGEKLEAKLVCPGCAPKTLEDRRKTGWLLDGEAMGESK